MLVQHTGGNLSWGRNRLVDACRTPCLLLLEDDFEFSEKTDLEALLDILTHDRELAGVGGSLVEQGTRRAWCHTFDVFRGRAALLPSEQPWRATPAGHVYRTCHALLNFGLFRRAVMADLRWDEQLPLSEHRDWYFRLWREGQWRVALAPQVSLLHHRDRPAEYVAPRGRNFHARVRRKHGLRFSAPPVQRPPVQRPPVSRPNLVVLGVGHANTSITTRQLAALGWNLGDADRAFAESVAVRAVNRRAIAGKRFDAPAAAAALRRLPAPWVVKDPRFAETLAHWLPVMLPYRPLLLWVTKDDARVVESYVRRGVRAHRAAALVAARRLACRRHFERWPWPKLQVDAEQVRAAAAMFDLSR